MRTVLPSILGALFFSTLAVSSPAVVRAGRLDGDADRIMELALADGTVLSSAIVIYPYRGRWALPLGQFADALGIGVTVWSKNRLAEGFVIDESRKFRLNLKTCEVTYDGKTEPVRCDEIVEHDNEFYVQDTLLMRWFPVDIEVNSLLSQVLVTARELLPAQARLKREQGAGTRRPEEEVDPGFRRETIPYNNLGFFALDQQLEFSSDRSTGIGRMFNGTSFFSGEVAGLESSFLANYTEQELAGWRLTASRRSPDGDLWGRLKLSQASLVDVDLPTIPLVTQAQPVRGFLLSSYPLNDPLNWENTDLQGVLPAGWEVLLFRNEVFFDRRVGDASGWYRFTNIPLQYGRNIMKLVFFGPHGERREEYRNFPIDREHQKAGRRDYRLALGFKPTDGSAALSFRISESLTRSITGQGGVYAENETGRRFATLGLVGLTDFALATGRVAYSLDGGYPAQEGAQTGFGALALGGKYTLLSKFYSQLFNQNVGAVRQKEQLEANAFYLLPTGPGLVRTSDFLHRAFENGNRDNVWQNRLTTTLANVQIQTQVDWSPSSPQPFFGRTEFFHFPYALRFRGVVEFDFKTVTAVEFETQYVRPDKYQLTGNIRVVFDRTPVRLLLLASKFFVKSPRELSSMGIHRGKRSSGPSPRSASCANRARARWK